MASKRITFAIAPTTRDESPRIRQERTQCLN
jgi:hypothetical protein